MTNRSPSVCTILTSSGRSAVAVIGIYGDHSSSAIDRCFAAATSRPLALNEIRYGDWHGPLANSCRESVVLLMRSERHFEIHCHGGIAAVDRIVADLASVGLTPVEHDHWEQWQKTPTVIREATDVLNRCTTTRTAAIALTQVRGALQNWITQWTQFFSSRESVVPLDPFRHELDTMLSYAPVSTRLSEPFRVVLYGRPNVGKSSLVNAIVGYCRSITTPIAGTTRDVLHAETVIDGLPIQLSDTAGIHETSNEIEREGILRAMQEFKGADLVLAVYAPDAPDAPDALGTPSSAEVLQIYNKSDLSDLPVPSSFLPTVATTGAGIADLLEAISGKLTANFPPPDVPLAMNKRQESILRELRIAGNSSEIVRFLSSL